MRSLNNSQQEQRPVIDVEVERLAEQLNQAGRHTSAVDHFNCISSKHILI